MGDPPGDTTIPPSLVGITVRRSATTGRFFLIYGSAISVVLGVSLSLSGGSAFASAFPLFLPVFAVVGSMGALTVFTTDRMKGVLEYLMAYGITPRRLFANVLLAAVVLVTVVLCVAVGVGLGVYTAKGHALTLSLAESIGLYGIPMAYASAAFSAILGMFWTSLSSPSQGLNSPIGLAPLIGIIPPMLTVAVIGVAAATISPSATELDLIGITAVLVVVVAVIVLLSLTGRLLARERLLSPA
jgi:hypothetical protein